MGERGEAVKWGEGAVLLVSEPVVPGGITVYTSSLMTGLSAENIPHPLITGIDPIDGLLPETESDSFDVVPGLFNSLWWPFIGRRLRAWAREQETVLIHGLSAVTAPICARLAALMDVPYLVTVHHFQKRGALTLDPHCHAVATVSEALREHLINETGVPKEMVRMIHGGIHVPKDLPMRPAAYQGRGEASVPLVSSFGKLVTRKDFPTFLHAARKVLDTLGRECSFVIAGDGPEESRLRKLARELKIEHHLTFCHGSVATAELLRDTDVYVQCSRVEGFGTMVLQAMGHGVPVVATATGGLLTLVKDNESGFIIPIGDADALAARIVNLLNDAELSTRLGEAGRETAAADYSVERMMEQTIDLYHEIRAKAPVAVG